MSGFVPTQQRCAFRVLHAHGVYILTNVTLFHCSSFVVFHSTKPGGQVAADEKGRMTIASLSCEESDNPTGPAAAAAAVVSKLFIRANQGHSIKGVVDEDALLIRVQDASDVPVCVHGTNLKSWPRSDQSAYIRPDSTAVYPPLPYTLLRSASKKLRLNC